MARYVQDQAEVLNKERTMVEQHPAAVWARQAALTPSDVDCITAVMLKILDGKCKMGTEEKAALTAIYEVTRGREGTLFDASVHQRIAMARHDGTGHSGPGIHQLRLQAEAMITKPVMKAFKAMLRSALEGL